MMDVAAKYVAKIEDIYFKLSSSMTDLPIDMDDRLDESASPTCVALAAHVKQFGWQHVLTDMLQKNDMAYFHFMGQLLAASLLQSGLPFRPFFEELRTLSMQTAAYNGLGWGFLHAAIWLAPEM